MPAFIARRPWSEDTDLGRFEYDEIMDVISFYPKESHNPDWTVSVDALDELLAAIDLDERKRGILTARLRGF